MPAITRARLQELSFFKNVAHQKYKPYVDELVSLFKERKIANFSTALKIAGQLIGPGKAPSAGINALEK